MKDLLDRYSIQARYFPAILCSLPLLILWYFVKSTNSQAEGVINYIFSIEFLGSFTLVIILIYFYAQIIRYGSKYFENRYFINKDGFPTSYLMLFSNSKLSQEYKLQYRIKIKNVFNFELMNIEEENLNKGEAIKRLSDVTKMVLNYLDEGRMVLNHNIWYGFSRNMVGGAVFGLIFSLINIIIENQFLPSAELRILSIIILGCYLLILLFHKVILIQNAEAFAKQVFSEFLSKKS